MDFPSWLPEDVSIHAEYALRIPDKESTAIKRLTSDLRMRDVWEKLSEEAPNAQSQRVEALIDYVVSILDYWETLNQSGLRLTRTEQRDRITEIHAAIDNLENILDRNAPLLVGYWTDRTNPINAELARIKKGLDKYQFFWDELPTKINAKNAKRAFFMRGLKLSLAEQYGKPLHSLIATITNVALDEDVTEDDVSKA